MAYIGGNPADALRKKQETEMPLYNLCARPGTTSSGDVAWQARVSVAVRYNSPRFARVLSTDGASWDTDERVAVTALVDNLREIDAALNMGGWELTRELIKPLERVRVLVYVHGSDADRHHSITITSAPAILPGDLVRVSAPPVWPVPIMHRPEVWEVLSVDYARDTAECYRVNSCGLPVIRTFGFGQITTEGAGN